MSSTYHCCCGPCRTHVTKGALIVALLGMVLSTLDIFANVNNAEFNSTSDPEARGIHFHSSENGVKFSYRSAVSSNSVSDWNIIINMIMIVLYILVILGQLKDIHFLYLPFLTFGIFNLVRKGCIIILIIPKCINNETANLQPEMHNFILMFCFFIVGFLLFFLALHIWIYSIIYRAYKVLKTQNTPVRDQKHQEI